MAERGESLSDRELDVLQRLAAGESNKAIADGLSISPYTVKTHLRNIFIKLDVSTRTEATTVAIQQGVLSVGGSDDRSILAGRPPDAAAAEEDEWAMAPVDAGANGQSAADVALPMPAGSPVVSHRWRNLSLALLTLLLLTAALFLSLIHI